MIQQPTLKPATLECAEAVFALGDWLPDFIGRGAIGFAGPIARAGYVQGKLVEGRQWISNTNYLEGVAFSQLSPGPLAAEIVGVLLHGRVG
jgi:chromate transporter